MPSDDTPTPDWATLLDATASLVDAVDEADLIRHVCEAARRTGGHPVATYHRFASQTGTLELAGVAGPSGFALHDRLSVPHPSGTPCLDEALLPHEMTVVQVDGACRTCDWQTPARALDAYVAAVGPITVDGAVDGILTVYGPRENAFSGEIATALTALARHAGIGLSRIRDRARTEAALEGTIQALVATVEFRDPYTAGHQKAVAALACRIADQMGTDPSIREGARLAALTHDIGKIAIPSALLTKPGRLRESEMALLRDHAMIGEEILSTVPLPWPIATIVGQHHERLDGTGYPRGLHGDDILLESRIVTVADVFDAMSTTRPYRVGKGVDATIAHLREESGRLFDPDVVAALLDVLDR